MKRRLKAFTLIELLVVIAIIALLISILLPSLSRARELSKRLVCMANIKGIGTSCKIYANDNSERWPIPPFDRDLQGDVTSGIDYHAQTTPVGDRRFDPSYSKDPGASSQLSVTRSYWMLVRSGDVTVQQFICPSSTDVEDPTENIELYYDFETYGNVSYGYQVPFGPADTQPREGMDTRMVISADKGPFYINTQPDWTGGQDPNNDILLQDSAKSWRRFNSVNHGGSGNGEGQNCLFADGHATFKKKPLAGIDNDNIYTVIENDWSNVEGFNRIHGLLPGENSPASFPGQEAFGTGPGNHASTDSLIYP